MNGIQNSTGYIVLGSILALITSLALEVIKNWFKVRNDSKDFKIIIKLELKSIVQSIDRLVDDYGQKQYFPIVILDELLLKLQRAEKIREKITHIKDDLKKEEILSLLNDIYIFYTDTNSLESNAFSVRIQKAEGTPTNWNDE